MGNILMFALLALVAVVVIGFVMRKMKGGNNTQGQSPFAMQGAGNTATPKSYSPENVGNDASARPWERSSTAFDTVKPSSTGSMIGSGLSGSQAWGVPADFDADGFLKACKGNMKCERFGEC